MSQYTTLQKKGLAILPSPAGMSRHKLFPARESLVSDIPAGDGKIANFFYSVYTIHNHIAQSDLVEQV
jgi:hypothetical protein